MIAVMRIPRLFHPETLSVGTKIQLSESAFQHAVRVLRLRLEAPIILFDGHGGEYTAHLCEIGKRGARAHIDAFAARETESPLAITLGQCISKPEHMDIAIQKTTELGVAVIQPLISERNVVNLRGERLQKKLSHWQGIIQSACEQCGRNRLPLLEKPLALQDWLANSSNTTLNLLLDLSSPHSLRQVPQTGSAIYLLIGPEGGLSEAELQHAYQRGFMGIRLGPRILRTETAALTILAALNTLWGDLA